MEELQKRVQKGDMIHYMDDILIDSQTFDEMYEKLERILKVLKECGLTLNLDNCELNKKSITFLGHQIHAEGISPGEIRTNAIRIFPRPAHVTDMRKFLGLTVYFRKFVAGYAIISAPLRILLRKDQPFSWKAPQEEAFDEFKKMPSIKSSCHQLSSRRRACTTYRCQRRWFSRSFATTRGGSAETNRLL